MYNDPDMQAAFNRWASMVSRCHRKTNKSYKYYGGRGVYVCDRWRKSFRAFLDDMGFPPLGMTLGRVDNDGPYEKDNCRWETWSEQAKNRRKRKLGTFYGDHVCFREVSRKHGLPPGAVASRKRMGWPEQFWTAPIGSRLKTLTHRGPE